MTSCLRTIIGWHRPLAYFAAAMVALAVVSLVGYFADHRILVGVPIWAKPLKFSISFALYSVTLAWLVSRLRGPRAHRLAWRAGATLAVASTFEMGAIVLQVVRGQQSHFNVSTPFDSAVFDAMGGLVGVIYLATVVIAVSVLVGSPNLDQAVTWAVRLGLGISILGMSVGFLMLRPTAAQSAQHDPALQGAHSVGVPDGGPSLPFVGWSTTGGDLRIPHFVGLHALQILPLLALALSVVPVTARLPERDRVRLVLLGAFTYAGVFGLTLWQALRGQPITGPDGSTLAGLLGIVLVVGLGLAGVVHGARIRPLHGT